MATGTPPIAGPCKCRLNPSCWFETTLQSGNSTVSYVSRSHLRLPIATALSQGNTIRSLESSPGFWNYYSRQSVPDMEIREAAIRKLKLRAHLLLFTASQATVWHKMMRDRRAEHGLRKARLARDASGWTLSV